VRCKNCFHPVEFHDEDEGFCNAKIYHTDSRENVSVPERCDCLRYEPELETTQLDRSASKRSRRIHTLEILLETENRLLREQGRRSSKRLRKLAERWERTIQSSDDSLNSEADGEESETEDMPCVDPLRPPDLPGSSSVRSGDWESAK
jgi:hypothetical protein